MCPLIPLEDNNEDGNADMLLNELVEYGEKEEVNAPVEPPAWYRSQRKRQDEVKTHDAYDYDDDEVNEKDCRDGEDDEELIDPGRQHHYRRVRFEVNENDSVIETVFIYEKAPLEFHSDLYLTAEEKDAILLDIVNATDDFRIDHPDLVLELESIFRRCASSTEAAV
jgi:hypothetical protein